MRSASQFSEFRLRSGEIEIEFKRAGPAAAPAPATAPAGPSSNAIAPIAEAPRASADPESLPRGTELVRAPMVGTFYRAPEPGGKPFVEVGQRVEADSTVCIIEVMKLMNSIPARHAGVVTHIFVSDAGPVEQGQALVAIDTTR